MRNETKVEHGTRLVFRSAEQTVDQVDFYEDGHCAKAVGIARDHQFRDTGEVDKSGHPVVEAKPDAWDFYHLQPVSRPGRAERIEEMKAAKEARAA